MATIKGQNLRVFIGNKPIAAALQCQLQVQLNVQQYSSKDDSGDFAKYYAASLQWNVTASGVVSNDVGRNDAASLLDRRGATVRVQLSLSSGNLNSEQGDTLVAGDAILSDINITAENRKRGTFDIVLTGKRDMLFDLRMLITSDNHCLRTTDGHILFAAHEEV